MLASTGTKCQCEQEGTEQGKAQGPGERRKHFSLHFFKCENRNQAGDDDDLCEKNGFGQ